MSNPPELRRLPLLPLGGLGIVVLAAFAAIWLSFAQAEQNRWVTHTLRVELAIAGVRERLVTAESAFRGYLVSGNSDLLTDMVEAELALDRDMAVLDTETRDNPRQQAGYASLVPLVQRKLAISHERIALFKAGQRARAIMPPTDPNRNGRIVMARIRAMTDTMIAEEERLLAARQWRARLITSLLSAFLAMTAALTLLVGLLMTRDARRRYRMMKEARNRARAAEAEVRDEIARREVVEAELRQVQKMETIGQLTGGIAHDFNNMMAIVIGSLDMAGRRLDQPDRLAKCIDHAREGAERAAALTARLLAFARRQPLAPVAIDGNKLVGGMSELLRRSLGENIAVETVLAGGLWRSFADPGQLESALVNLAVNARDAMVGETGQSGGKLTIETANAHLDDAYARQRGDVTPGHYVMFGVSDMGHGMDVATMERAFDPFFTTKEVGKGTGLGLSQVFGFAKQSGGHVAIYSEPGQGTTVKLYLPRYQGPVVDLPDRAQDGPLPTGRADEIILVVEDEQRVRHFSVDALREMGYTAISAANGEEALRLLDEQPSVRMIFTDVVMPEMNGKLLADAARARRPDIRILYTTGYTRNAVVHNGMLDAGVAFLPKPFTIAQLAWKVREVLDGGGANRPG